MRATLGHGHGRSERGPGRGGGMVDAGREQLAPCRPVRDLVHARGCPSLREGGRGAPACCTTAAGGARPPSGRTAMAMRALWQTAPRSP
eukprot:CAMPEP_0206013344 /NCGR_PEP_ID=MMETSP1464-20131121/16315_1 /ASSEMBLY_ACC=CAM_ASM_001124 /TAXON_ID=119497 /ORGANISM="Exanthemachrysis gayraliae, Strain RCC1523" /LENGTH=88 /DNA_ID=CAMNT_0053387059 /DNA_START=160 /DNA_END=422 /DNA_ORIENTATION=+